MIIKRIVFLMLPFVLMALLGACDDDNGDSNSRVRLIQAGSKTQALSLFVDETLYGTLPYADVGPYQEYGEAVHSLRGEIGGNSVFSTDLQTFSDIDYSIVVVPEGGSVTPLVFVDENERPDLGNFKIRAINASAQVPLVDVYVLRENDFPAGHQPTFENLAFKQASRYDQIDRNEYQIFITLPGSSVAIATLSSTDFGNREVWTLYVLDDPNGGGVTVRLEQDREGNRI